MTCIDDSKADLSSSLFPTNISSPYNYVNVIIIRLFVERLYYVTYNLYKPFYAAKNLLESCETIWLQSLLPLLKLQEVLHTLQQP